MEFFYDTEVKNKFPNLKVALGFVSNLKQDQKNSFKNKQELVYQNLKNFYSIENLKDSDIMRVYRDFFWALGIDPTKTRPASEALIRRVLRDKPIPRINCVVDAYNLASMESGIPLAAFDSDLLKGNIVMRFSEIGEEFMGIGMKKTINLKGNELILTDNNQIIAIYPYRDADNTKVTTRTKNVALLICGFPGISNDKLENTADLAIEYITEICGGKGSYKIFE
ncbi:MAG: B3/B4 domain-containing protein [Candidatus Helarchaeota archaeon]